MTEEELRKDYYADRPSEPYSDDDRPSDWANIAHYAEENLENAFKRIEELGKENAKLKKQQFSLRNERNTFLAQNEQYEKDLIDFNENLTKAKELLKRLIETTNPVYFDEDRQRFRELKIEAVQFLKEVKENDR